jgi:hypothetical protein
VQLAPLVIEVSLAQRVRLGLQVPKAFKAFKAFKVKLDLQAQRVQLAQRELILK